VHDLLYEAIRASKMHPASIGDIDALYLRMLEERGVGGVKLFFRRAGLFLFGWTGRSRSKGPQYPRRKAA
jgi:hypothetical protein